ncbi:HAD family hydrolase [Oerskovia merdavium]|uniref:HAD-IA family hydrolase n=1 Tax=Oerskovia merdavium TaxID=2762227 RepID=A0ABR8U1Q0_9CELL|nr:HAD family hydrolase [Oerskovia merdavium]MBD7981628.1 HAD-IA family hydrolase [Oerskovia merdavium]
MLDTVAPARALFVDLDNTLVDRAGAFAAWASAFTSDRGLGADAARWLVEADGDGYTPRAALAEQMRARFHLPDDVAHLVDRLLFEHLAWIAPYPGVTACVEAFRSAGIPVVVVTNGTAGQQWAKLDRTGLVDLVSGVVISEEVGVAKPDRRIFAAASAVIGSACSAGPGSAWMVGDHPVADVRGGRDAGLRTGWVAHGRAWAEDWSPDVARGSTVEVLGALLEATPRSDS